ncbi:MAG: hypothetical protein J6T10_10480 [Methanobrevibacter sp.]|nr:hypothetical protein [Methanobrevibacter sp.]
MIFRIKLNLLEIKNHTFTENIDLVFDNTQNFEYCAESDAEHITKLHLYCTLNSVLLNVYLDYGEQPSFNFDGSDIEQFSTNDEFVIFDTTIDDSDIATLYQFYEMGIVDFVLDAQTLLFVYKQNSDNEHLNKDLTFVNIISGNFNHSIGVKNINVDIQDFELNFNYVFMPNLNRYYYVDSVEIISADISRLHLKEDVLMTWKNLIMQQKGLITRWQKGNLFQSSRNIVDNRLPLESTKSVEFITPTATSTGSKVNITLDTNIVDGTKRYFMLSCYAERQKTSLDSVTPPQSDLPTIKPTRSSFTSLFFLTQNEYFALMKGLIELSNLLDYVNAIIMLPFDPTNVFNVQYNPINDPVYVQIGLPESKRMSVNGSFYPISTSGIVWATTGYSLKGTSPYLVVADFTLPEISDVWYNREPYCTYEIFIPFVSWIKIPIQDLAGKRLLVYYTIDFTTGGGTAYLYNYTDGKVLYSSSCQLGIKLDVLSTNALELARERQAVQLNTIMGLLGAGLTTAFGAYSSNPTAVAGGVLGAGKVLASGITKTIMQIEHGSVTYGSGDGAIHSNINVMIRKTYNKRINIDSNTYATTQGYPINEYDDFNNYDGYVEIGDLHFEPKNENIYQDEITEIVSLLKNGVIF